MDQICLYYPELHNTAAQFPAKPFLSDAAAVEYYLKLYGKNLQAVIKDDREGNISVVF